ncbi:MAG: hypothetical protein E6I52_25250 [Chloroflexi bacterium]|nr:MAG: hypothetical protein E6I52_25250 [Chloroflexota bacterium]
MRSTLARHRWRLAAIAFVAGLALWLVGITWGIALAGASLLASIVLAWVDVAPRGGHAHDDGMDSRGVTPPSITTHLRRR